MNAFEATLLAYYTLRLPSCPGYEKAARFEGLMNFDNHIASIRRRATLVDGYLDTLDLFNIAWTLGVIDWHRRSGRAATPEISEKIISFLEIPRADSICRPHSRSDYCRSRTEIQELGYGDRSEWLSHFSA